ncbi:Cysteine-rich secretory protein family protein [uncultured archaeon]|nr:Cysteine-rich secretory protein family protein [uncultured archaeon]
MKESSFKKWFFKKNDNVKFNETSLLLNLLFFVILVVSSVILYGISPSLNSNVFLFIKLGSLVLLVVLFFCLSYFFKLLGIFSLGFKSFENGYKLISLVILLILLLTVLSNQDGFSGFVKQKLDSVDFSRFNPVELQYSSVPTPTSNLLKQPVLENTPIPTVIPPSSNVSLSDLKSYVLQLINKDRSDNGLPPVVLDDNVAAQDHAEEMLSLGVLSHWSSNGDKPYMRYTKAGGLGSVDENVAFQAVYSSDSSVMLDPKQALSNEEFQMMYNDSGSNWGHRDNILTKQHNKFSIGIGFDSTSLYLVEDFEDVYINWSQTPSFSNGTLSLSGINSLGKIHEIGLFYDPLPTSLTKEQMAASHSYSLGSLIGYVIPLNYYVSGSPYVNAQVFDTNDNGIFNIQADISSLLNNNP